MGLLYMIQIVSRKKNRDVLTPEFVQKITGMCRKGNNNMVNVMKVGHILYFLMELLYMI